MEMTCLDACRWNHAFEAVIVKQKKGRNNSRETKTLCSLKAVLHMSIHPCLYTAVTEKLGSETV